MKQTLKGYPGLYQEAAANGTTRFRIVIHHDTDVIQEYFHSGADVTERAAKNAAIARWREIRKTIPVLTKRKFREVLRKPTASGISGVTRLTTYPRGHQYDVWKATWTTRKGVRESRQFSINKYGEKEAKRLALECRREALDKIGAE